MVATGFVSGKPIVPSSLNLITGGGYPVVAIGFALLRTVPGTLMRNPNETYVIAPVLAGQGVSA